MPFPFVEQPRLRMRPAVLITTQPLGGAARLGWTLMITSLENAGWPDDVSLEQQYEECGLPVPCVIRTAKIATVELGSVRRMGRLPPDLIDVVKAKLAQHLPL